MSRDSDPVPHSGEGTPMSSRPGRDSSKLSSRNRNRRWRRWRRWTGSYAAASWALLLFPRQNLSMTPSDSCVGRLGLQMTDVVLTAQVVLRCLSSVTVCLGRSAEPAHGGGRQTDRAVPLIVGAGKDDD